MGELSKVALTAVAAALVACGGATASRPLAEPSPVSTVVVSGSPAATPVMVSAPEATESDDATVVVPSSDEAAVARPSASAPATANAAQPGTSPESVAKARDLFSKGVMAAQEGRYADARDAFEAAYLLAPRPPLLYNLARMEMQLGNTAKACQQWAAWLKTASPTKEQLRHAAANLQQCGINP